MNFLANLIYDFHGIFPDSSLSHVLRTAAGLTICCSLFVSSTMYLFTTNPFWKKDGNHDYFIYASILPSSHRSGTYEALNRYLLNKQIN